MFLTTCVCFCSGYIQGMNIIMESEVSLSAALRNDSFEEVLIGEGIILLNLETSSGLLLLESLDKCLT